MQPISFTINQRLSAKRGRAGTLKTPHGDIETPAFVVVGTKGTVKALTPEQVLSLSAQIVLANTYHLYLQPGEDIVRQAGGLHAFMHWDGPMATDSGGFQVFSLGAGFGQAGNKFIVAEESGGERATLMNIDEDGVSFRSHIDGSSHRFTPERSIDIQHAIGADIMFAFDECTSPAAPESYQKEAMERTHRWARRSLDHHVASPQAARQALFGIVQGGRFEHLRKESAKTIGAMGFDGFGVGGSFSKEDLKDALGWVVDELPEGKPRHLLGIGEPEDLFLGVENGIDMFDCVAPTRIARTGLLYTRTGKMNIRNATFVRDFSPIESDCDCYTCATYTRAYLAHLFRAHEMLAATLASIHNLRFLIRLVDGMRQSILNGTFEAFRDDFLTGYASGKR